ncbi:MAG: aspartate aminotransferase family protein [Clostridiales bacterium]|nr:aspartate aminotransferase family protein [Clostridiales bacterium]
MSIENDLSLIQDFDKNYYLQVFNPLPVAFVKGKGCYLTDTQGTKYIDMIGGIAVNSLGHAHPKLVKAIRDQAGNLIHCCNYYYIPGRSELANKLFKNSFADKAFFCNSGAEANEAAIKLARGYFHYKGENKYEIVTAKMSFHGRTLGTIAATGQPKFSEPFAPVMPGFTYVPFNDFEALKAACTPKTAAVMLELVQGESGVHPANIEYAKLVDKFCKDHGILLIIDEVQTGIGRTGMMFCHERYGITPDIITLAKGLAGGVPIGAMLCTDEVASGFHVGDHGTTFGGNPLACAAANAVLDTIKEDNLLVNVNDMNAYLMEKLAKLKSKYDCITDIRGLGLLIGIEFDERISASQMMIEMFRNGILVSSIGTSTIRLAPPLIIGKKEIDAFCKVLDGILKNTIPAKKGIIDVIKDKLPSASKQVSVASFDKLPGEEEAAQTAPAEPSAPVAAEDDDM